MNFIYTFCPRGPTSPRAPGRPCGPYDQINIETSTGNYSQNTLSKG